MRSTSKTIVLAVLSAFCVSCHSGNSEESPGGSGGAAGSAGTAGVGTGGAAGAISTTGGTGGQAESGGVGGSAGMSTAQPDRDATCSAVCARAEPLMCRNDGESCSIECATLFDSTQCALELQALLACGAEAEPADWECDAATGEAQTKAGICDSELTAVQDCLAGR